MNEIELQKTSKEKTWEKLYLIGAIFTSLTIIGILLDVIIGNITGGNLTELPETAIERFNQLNTNKWLGLYNLDFVNLLNQILLIPGFYALCMLHRKSNKAMSYLALIISMIGTTIFVLTNPSLPMLELSNKFANTTNEVQKAYYAAAGETFLVRGEHGSLGAFIGFVLPNIGGLIIAIVMLRAKIFKRTASILGILGNSLILFYLGLVTFAPSVKEMATIFAMPGGLLMLTWMIIYTIKLFKISIVKKGI